MGIGNREHEGDSVYCRHGDSIPDELDSKRPVLFPIRVIRDQGIVHETVHSVYAHCPRLVYL